MASGQTRWYRLTAKDRTDKAVMLRSGRGRFHRDPVGEPTTYLADSIETAWAEVKVYFGEYTNPRAFRLWEVAVPAEVLNREVDLRMEEQRQEQGVTEQALRAIPAPDNLCELGTRLRGEGATGVIYWSVRNKPTGVCSAVFLEGGIEGQLDVRPLDDEWEGFIESGSPSGLRSE